MNAGLCAVKGNPCAVVHARALREQSSGNSCVNHLVKLPEFYDNREVITHPILSFVAVLRPSQLEHF